MSREFANWFIALPVPPGQLPRGATGELPPGTRAFHPDDLHVTVAFLGAVGEARALRAWAAVAAPPDAPLQARISARATFGNPRRPSALGVELDRDRSDSPLVRFIGDYRDALRRAADLDPESRAVRAHVTLGRPPRRPDRRWWRACERWCAAVDAPGPVRLDRIALYTRAEPDDERRFRIVRHERWTRSGRSRAGRA